MKRPGWTRLQRATDSTCHIWYRHESGWEVKHCGHPTANWPYHLVNPEHPLKVVVTFNGLGFRTLAIGVLAVEEILAGKMIETNENCYPNVRRTLDGENPYNNRREST